MVHIMLQHMIIFGQVPGLQFTKSLTNFLRSFLFPEPNVTKTFYCPEKLFQSSLMFVSKTGAYLSEATIKHSTLG